MNKYKIRYKLKILIHAVSILLISVDTYGQKDLKNGYIITNSYDTIIGFINLKSNYNNSKVCEFYKDVDENPIEYNPQDIKGYRIEDVKFYISKDIDLNDQKRKVFLEYLLNGIVDLYYYKELTTEYFFIEKDGSLHQLSNDEIEIFDKNGNMYQKYSNQYKGVLNYLLHDAPELSDKILNTEFKHTSLIKITKEYHDMVCEDYKCIEYQKSNNSSIYFESYLGFIESWMGLGTSTNHTHNRKPYVGINFRFTPKKIHYVWNFMIGINYSYNNFQEVFNNVLLTNDIERSYQVYTKYSILRLPIIVEYSFPTGKLRPFISVGYSNIFIINPDYDAFGLIQINPSRIYYQPMQSDFRKYQFGFSSDFGFKYTLSNLNYIYFKGSYEYRIPSVNTNHVFDLHYVNSLLLNFGYGMKIK